MALRLTLEILDVSALSPHELAVLAAITSFPPAANAASVIPHDDRPDVGAEPVNHSSVVLTELAKFSPVDALVAVSLAQAEPDRDFTKVFTAAAAPSVPVPPPPPVLVLMTPAPPAPPAETVSLPDPAAAATDVVPPVSVGSESVVVVDAAGLPWDARIHASTRAHNKDGTWRKIRNTDKSAAAIVEADLRAAAAIPPVPPGMPTPPASPAASFASFMAWTAKQISAERLKTSDTFEIIQPLGLQSIVSLQTRPDLLPAAYEAMRERIVGGEA